LTDSENRKSISFEKTDILFWRIEISIITIITITNLFRGAEKTFGGNKMTTIFTNYLYHFHIDNPDAFCAVNRAENCDDSVFENEHLKI